MVSKHYHTDQDAGAEDNVGLHHRISEVAVGLLADLARAFERRDHRLAVFTIGFSQHPGRASKRVVRGQLRKRRYSTVGGLGWAVADDVCDPAPPFRGSGPSAPMQHYLYRRRTTARPSLCWLSGKSPPAAARVRSTWNRSIPS